MTGIAPLTTLSVILPNTPAAESLSAAEVERRTQSFNARKALLRSNPSLYVSRTRLSIRQLPLFVTERMLKRLAVHAIRAFNKEVKDGSRDPLTPDELAEPTDSAGDEEGVKTEDGKHSVPKSKGKGKAKKVGRDTGVKQAKIVRQADRVDPVTGKGRSKGYGFLELTKHADALRVLRWANNNPEVGRLFEDWWKAELEDLFQIEKKKPQKDDARLKRIKDELEKGAPVKSRGTLIVEFSIENVQVVQRRAVQQREKQPVRPHLILVDYADSGRRGRVLQSNVNAGPRFRMSKQRGLRTDQAKNGVHLSRRIHKRRTTLILNRARSLAEKSAPSLAGNARSGNRNEAGTESSCVVHVFSFFHPCLRSKCH